MLSSIHRTSIVRSYPMAERLILWHSSLAYTSEFLSLPIPFVEYLPERLRNWLDVHLHEYQSPFYLFSILPIETKQFWSRNLSNLFILTMTISNFKYKVLNFKRVAKNSISNCHNLKIVKLLTGLHLKFSLLSDY